ncbi:MAG: hypothetical protein AAB660_01040 [Patescibacteria group bacterium]
MKTKNILFILLTVFILFVAYKYIASNIQENKEKAVIQERAYTQQAERSEQAYNLEQCFNLAQIDENSKTSWYLDSFHTKYGIDQNLWSPPIKAAMVKLVEEAKAETKAKRAECLKQYPQQ